MLDLKRLQRIKLSPKPLGQRTIASLALTPNYRLLPKVDIVFENAAHTPQRSVIFAMNHTDRYNYWPFQYKWWQDHGRFTATWVKGKYYENSVVATFMEHTNNIPTVSRGYLITKDCTQTLGRLPSDAEYRALRSWVDAESAGEPLNSEQLAVIPESLRTKARDILGHDFRPEEQNYASAINRLFSEMMRHFVALNHQALDKHLDILIFPQGTRSIHLSEGHIGLAEIALLFKIPIVPVGCSGSDKLYPGALPWARRGQVVYRFGEPIHYQDTSEFHIQEAYEPFTPTTETRYRKQFEGLTSLVMKRINDLVDEEYRFATEGSQALVQGSDRFI